MAEYNVRHPETQLDPSTPKKDYMKRQCRKILRAAQAIGKNIVAMTGGLGTGSFGWDQDEFEAWMTEVLQEEEFESMSVHCYKPPCQPSGNDWAGNTRGMRTNKTDTDFRKRICEENKVINRTFHMGGRCCEEQGIHI